MASIGRGTWRRIAGALPTRLAILLGVFVALALFYSVALPLFEGPDEDDHFRYVKFIADHHALPLQLFEPGGGEAGHQGWQPPLYYALAAGLISPIDTTDYAQHLWRNEGASYQGDPSCCGRNLYFHTSSEDLPFTRTTLAVHLLRLLSILFGLVTVAAAYAIADELVGGWAGVPLAAAAVVAFNPSFLFASALVSNDAALAACSSLVLLFWVRVLMRKTLLSWRAGAWLGLVSALALLTKTTAVALVPFSIFVLGLAAWRRRDIRAAFAPVFAMLGVIALAAGWWFVRNQVLYGDPLALRLVAVSALFPRAGPLTVPELFQISLPWLWQTFWGGPTPGDFSPVVLSLLALLTLLAAAGTLVFVRRCTEFGIRASFLLLAAWMGLIFMAQIEFIRTTTGGDQGRYLFPAIAAFGLFFAVGLAELGGAAAGILARRQQALAGVASGGGWLRSAAAAGRDWAARALQTPGWLVGGLALLAASVPFAYTLPAYAHPALLSSADLAKAPHPQQVNFGGRMALRGYDVPTHVVSPGGTLELSLYWQALEPMTESYRVFVHLIRTDDRSAGGTDVIPGRGSFPTVYWKPGDALRDQVHVPILPNAVPGKYMIEVGLYPYASPGERLPIVGSGEDRVLLDAIKVAPREQIVYSPGTRVGANFADRAVLLGYDASIASRSLTLTLYWQNTAPFDKDYTVFVHLLDQDGKIASQADQQPQAGNYPTSMWSVGEQIRDQYILPLAADPQQASYRIELGMYRSDTEERLQVRTGSTVSDHLLLEIPAGAR